MKKTMIALAIILPIIAFLSSAMFFLVHMGGPEDDPRWAFSLAFSLLFLIMQCFFFYANKHPEYKTASTIFLVGCFVMLAFWFPGLPAMFMLMYLTSPAVLIVFIPAFCLMAYNIIIAIKKRQKPTDQK
jgi:hypothetical protein